MKININRIFSTSNFKRYYPYFLVIISFLFFIPWFPPFASWNYEYVMHLAIIEKLQFGKDIISTYGPLGFITLNFYHSNTYLTLLIANIGLYIFMFFFLWKYWRDVIESDRTPLVWISAILLIPSFKTNDFVTSAIYLPYLMVNLLVFWHFLNEKYNYYVIIPLTIILAAFVLGKGNYFLLIILAFVIISADQLLILRKIPWLVLVFISAIIMFWVLSGQKITGLFSYFVSMFDIAYGYKDGMSINNRRFAPASAIIFSMSSVLTSGYLWLIFKKRIGWRSIFPILVFSITLFIVFQHGFTRAYKTSIIPAYLTLFMLWVFITPFIIKYSSLMKNNRSLLVLLITIVFIGMSLCGFPRWKVIYRKPVEFCQFITGGIASLENSKTINAKRIREKYSLPKLKDPISYYDLDFYLPETYGVQSMIIPSIIGFAAYTPDISRQNKNFIENKNGPKTILLNSHFSIDGRYPTVSDSLSVLALKSHFKAVKNTGDILILERRSRPLQLQLVIIGEQKAEFNKNIIVPENNSNIFVKIEINQTVWGKILNILYKPSPVFININQLGENEVFRLTTAMAKEGMLLSPLLNDLSDLQCFYDHSCPKAPLKVETFKITSPNGPKWEYRKQIKIAFLKIVAN